MTWVRVDDAIWSHRKIRAAGPEATGLFVCGLAWCNQNLSDGLIPSHVLGMLSDIRKPEVAAAKLVEAGLWHVHPDGWEVHDYLDYQPSKSHVESQRDAARDRKRRSRRDTPVTDGVSSDTPPHPTPRPSVATTSDDDTSSTGPRSSSGSDHPHWDAIAEAGMILARSKVPPPKDLDAYATRCARNILNEQGHHIGELVSLQPQLDRYGLAGVLAGTGAALAVENARLLDRFGEAPPEDFVPVADLRVVSE